ncbi:MAG: phosphatase PAP2 family protein [Gammaproteobacteria bacterium]|nr:phosphatase PAP2 family protein [Gammaproteobacteria bacterium]
MRTFTTTLMNHPGYRRLLDWDTALCRHCYRLQCTLPITQLLRAVSRLGDGVFWYALIVVLPILYGVQGLHASLHMAIVGLCCLLVYRWLKHRTARPRPASILPDVKLATAALDEFSFPSGHTLHAVAFSLIGVFHFPHLALLLVPLSLLIALSRPALGLHYPSDVFAGAVLGAGIAGVSLVI